MTLATLFTPPYPIIPPVLGGLFLLTGLWNILAARHVARRFREWGLPAQLRYPVAGVEFIASALLLWPASRGLGMLLATAILLASISFCLYKGIYQRLLLSIPMLLAVLLYYSTSC